MINFRSDALAPEDLDELHHALANAALPVTDLHENGRQFFRFTDADGVTIGFGGLEGEGPDRLIRSIVVMPDHRKRGAGCLLVAAIEDAARGLGVQRLHLLTVGAADFFRRADYVDAPRDKAPPPVAASHEFTTLCPASAAYLTKVL